MQNLVLLALFRAYAKVFRGDGIIAVEEPEIYLHPHAQRSLSSVFLSLAEQGNQVFYTTHSPHFVTIERFDQICLVERCEDEDGDVCTQVHTVTSERFLEIRQQLHPTIPMTIEGLRERYRNISNLEHSEAFFALVVVLVEGETEEFALPVYASALGYDFDVHGISVVNAYGKNKLDQFYQLYSAFKIPVYLIFDNDKGSKDDSALRYNETLLTMLGEQPTREPAGIVSNLYSVMENDFDQEMERSVGSKEYRLLVDKAVNELGTNVGKGIRARYMAKQLASENQIPKFIEEIVQAIIHLKPEHDYEGAIVDIPF